MASKKLGKVRNSSALRRKSKGNYTGFFVIFSNFTVKGAY
jgi:hypothetical protein